MNGTNTRPYVGAMVNYWPDSTACSPRANEKMQPYPAVVTHVFSESHVNLRVFDDGEWPCAGNGMSDAPTGVPRREHGVCGHCWDWIDAAKEAT